MNKKSLFFATFIIIFTISIISSGCLNKSDNTSLASLNLMVEWKTNDPKASPNKKFALPAEVKTIKITIASGNFTKTKTFDPTPNIATIDGVPLGTATITLQGLNSASQISYQGSSTVEVSNTGSNSTLITATKIMALASLSLSPASKTVVITESINLASFITVLAKSEDNSEDNVTTNATWELITDKGKLTDTTYTAPSTEGNDYIKVSYTRNNVTKTAVLEVPILTLSSITLNPTTKTVVATETMALSEIQIAARYSDFSEQLISATSYEITTGAGTITSGVFTAPTTAGVSKIKYSVKKADITKTAELTINTIDLTSIALTPSTISTSIKENYDLKNIEVKATFSDASSRVQIQDLTWTLAAGAGTVSGSTYKGGDDPGAGAATIQCSLTKGAAAKTANLTVNLIKLDSIKINPTSITPVAGANYDLSNIAVTAAYNTGDQRTVTGSTFVIKSGQGSITDKTYTAGTSNAVILVIYTEGGITKTADFTVQIGN